MATTVTSWIKVFTCSLSVQAGLPLNTECIIRLVQHICTRPRRASTPAAGDD